MDKSNIFINDLTDISEQLQNILDEFPENNGGYDYIVDAIRYINTVIDEYMD